MARKMIKVSVVGGTGYTGVELLRLLSRHPAVELMAVTSRAQSGQAVSELFPNLRGVIDLRFTQPDIAMLKQSDVVFFSTPNGTAMTMARELLDANVRVIDLAADFRLKDAQEWRRWYGIEHACPELLAEAVYGFPEVNRESIRSARLVANPGCYPTAVQLGFLPLLENDLVDSKHLIADAKSGVSGAGRKESVDKLFAEAADNLKAYGVSGHRHQPEICQGLNAITGHEVGLTFVPHLIPMIRGIHATLYAVLTDNSRDLQAIYQQRYENEPFVDVMEQGAHPETRSVRGGNQCRIAIHRPHGMDTVVVLAVIDNLVKGAAGQALQNFNLMNGFDETTGLDLVAIMP